MVTRTEKTIIDFHFAPDLGNDTKYDATLDTVSHMLILKYSSVENIAAIALPVSALASLCDFIEAVQSDPDVATILAAQSTSTPEPDEETEEPTP